MTTKQRRLDSRIRRAQHRERRSRRDRPDGQDGPGHRRLLRVSAWRPPARSPAPGAQRHRPRAKARRSAGGAERPSRHRGGRARPGANWRAFARSPTASSKPAGRSTSSSPTPGSWPVRRPASARAGRHSSRSTTSATTRSSTCSGPPSPTAAPASSPSHPGPPHHGHPLGRHPLPDGLRQVDGLRPGQDGERAVRRRPRRARPTQRGSRLRRPPRQHPHPAATPPPAARDGRRRLDRRGRQRRRPAFKTPSRVRRHKSGRRPRRNSPTGAASTARTATSPGSPTARTRCLEACGHTRSTTMRPTGCGPRQPSMTGIDAFRPS